MRVKVSSLLIHNISVGGGVVFGEVQGAGAGAVQGSQDVVANIHRNHLSAVLGGSLGQGVAGSYK